MSQVVAFPDAEALTVAYLRAALAEREDGARVATRITPDGPDRRVRVSRTGGLRRDEITDMPQLTIECWDTNSADASDLARLTRALMWALPGDTTHGRLVRDVDELGGPTFFADPTTDLPRYQFTVIVNIRGEAI